jgi:hypothetical protein
MCLVLNENGLLFHFLFGSASMNRQNVYRMESKKTEYTILIYNNLKY